MKLMSRQFCDFLGISYQSMLNWLKEGMPAEKSGNYYFFGEDSFVWVKVNKPKHAEKAAKKLEVENG